MKNKNKEMKDFQCNSLKSMKDENLVRALTLTNAHSSPHHDD